MSQKQFVVVIVVSALMSLIGGLAGGALFSARSAVAQDAPAKGKPAPEVAATVHAREFVLVDSKGGKRAELNVNDAGATAFSLYDSQSQEKLSIKCADEKFMLHVNGHDKKPLFLLMTHDDPKDRAVMFAVQGVKGQPVFSVQHRGHPEAEKKKLEETYVSVSDGSNPRLIMGHNGDNNTLLSFVDKDENATVTLTSSLAHGQYIKLRDVRGKAEGVLMAHDGAAAVQVKSVGHYAQGSAIKDAALWQVAKDDIVRLVAGMGADATPRVKCTDEKGKEIWSSDSAK